MKLVALKATPMVPWFDDITLFREVGVFNLGERGVFVIAEYVGEKDWDNEVDPSSVLADAEAEVMKFSAPEVVPIGTEFSLSGTYKHDGKYIVNIGQSAASVDVVSGKFSKKLTISQSGTFQISCQSAPCEPRQIIIAL